MDAHDPASRLLYARIGDEVVASMRIHLGSDGDFPEAFKVVYDLPKFAPTVPYEQMTVLSRFMVSKAYRYSPVSFGLMHAIAEFHLQRDTQLCFLACAPHLLNLYIGLGYRTYTRNYNDAEVGFVVPMVYVIRDLNYLAGARSPLLRVTRQYVTPVDIPSWADSILPSDSTVRSEQSDAEKYWSQVYALLTEKSQGKHSTLDGLSEDQTKLLLAKGHVIECYQGELVIRKGTLAHGIFVVLSGVAEVRDGDKVLAVLGAGEVFGEMGFLLASPRSANVYAVSDHARILSLDETILRRLIETDPATSAKFLLNLSKVLCLRLAEVQSRFTTAEY